jgi:molybdopterin-guanine dinucleotide biosynthesis adapter protein
VRFSASARPQRCSVLCYNAVMRIIGLAGWSGAGKTTLIQKLIPAIIARGLTVSTLKHAHHGFDVDQPGKDSYVHRGAGAREVLVASPRRFALMHELRGAPEPRLSELLVKLAPVDLVLIEGFKNESHPKLEVYRAANGKPLIHPDHPSVVAIAADRSMTNLGIPWVHIDDIEGIIDIILAHAAPIETMPPARSP